MHNDGHITHRKFLYAIFHINMATYEGGGCACRQLGKTQSVYISKFIPIRHCERVQNRAEILKDNCKKKANVKNVDPKLICIPTFNRIEQWESVQNRRLGGRNSRIVDRISKEKCKYYNCHYIINLLTKFYLNWRSRNCSKPEGQDGKF